MYLFSGFSIRLVLSIIIAIVPLWIIFRFRTGKTFLQEHAWDDERAFGKRGNFTGRI